MIHIGHTWLDISFEPGSDTISVHGHIWNRLFEDTTAGGGAS